MERGVSYTQTTCAPQPSTLPSKKLNKEVDTLLQKQQSACESRQDASHGVSSAEPRGKSSLQVSWNGVDLENTDAPKFLGVTLDRRLSYKTHIHARTIRTTALALCYSTAEYAAPVWERSAYAHLLNPELNQTYRVITGCLKPTNVENLYLLAEIAPPEIRRSVCARVEKTKQIIPNKPHDEKR